MSTDINTLIEQVAKNQSDFLTEQKNFSGDVKTAVATLQSRIEEMDKRFAAGGGSPRSGDDPVTLVTKGIGEHLAAFHQNGRARFEVKSPLVLIERKGFSSAGLTVATASPVIGLAAGANFGDVAALFRVEPIEGASAFQIRETSATGWAPSPQVESSDKAESTATLTGTTLGVRTLAHWVRASKQSLDDVVGLGGFIRSRLLWGLAKEVEGQLLSGDNTGENLCGIVTTATAFDTDYLSTSNGWEFADVLGAAAVQCRVNGFMPDFAVVHPADAYLMQFAKDSTGQYITNAPNLPRIVQSTEMTQGTFCVGDSGQAVIRMRQAATIDLSEEHSDFFIKNMIAIRAELRMLLQTISPSAFIYGSLSSSPA